MNTTPAYAPEEEAPTPFEDETPESLAAAATAEKLAAKAASHPGRNAPCPCGSGKKSKKCCHSAADKAARHQRAWAPPTPPAPDMSDTLTNAHGDRRSRALMEAADPVTDALGTAIHGWRHRPALTMLPLLAAASLGGLHASMLYTPSPKVRFP